MVLALDGCRFGGRVVGSLLVFFGVILVGVLALSSLLMMASDVWRLVFRLDFV